MRRGRPERLAASALFLLLLRVMMMMRRRWRRRMGVTGRLTSAFDEVLATNLR